MFKTLVLLSLISADNYGIAPGTILPNSSATVIAGQPSKEILILCDKNIDSTDKIQKYINSLDKGTTTTLTVGEDCHYDVLFIENNNVTITRGHL